MFQRTITSVILPRSKVTGAIKAALSRAESPSKLSFGNGRCPHKATVLSCLDGELLDHPYPSYIHHSYWDPLNGTGGCPTDSEAFETDHWSSSFVLYCEQLLSDPPLGMGGPILLCNTCSFRSDLLLHPACPWVSGSPGCKLGALLNKFKHDWVLTSKNLLPYKIYRFSIRKDMPVVSERKKSVFCIFFL